MYCPNCGAKNANSAKFCKECGKPLADNPVAEEPKSPTTELPAEQEKFIDSAAWGPSLGIYFAAMDAWLLFLLGIIAGAAASFTVLLSSIGFTLYAIYKGRRIAWDKRKWKNFEQYKEVQEKWDTWAKWIWGIFIVLTLAGIAFSELE